MILLQSLNIFGAILCIYALISTKFNTKRRDVAIIYICLLGLFILNVYATFGTLSQLIVFASKNIILFVLLVFVLVMSHEASEPYRVNICHNMNKLRRKGRRIKNKIKGINKEVS